jgi:Flp pilus assembly protein TadG
MCLKSGSHSEGKLTLRLRENLSRLLVAQGIGSKERQGQYRRVVSDEDGATMVEMALSLTVLLAMLFGIIEMSFTLYSYHYIADAAREGTRYAIVRGSSCSVLTNCNATAAQIQTYVEDLGYPGINSTAHMTVTTTWWTPTAPPNPTWTQCTSGSCNVPGNAVQVNVTYASPLSIPYWKATTFNISSTSRMVISN